MDETESKIVAFVLYPGLTALDLVGPLQVFSLLSQFSPINPVVVGATTDPMPSDCIVQLSAGATFDEVPHPFALVVPGGAAPTLKALGDEQLVGYIRSAAESAEIVASVCTGSLLLGAAGLLDGRKATTHWGFYQVLERLGATYVADRWVEDGKFIMSAGISAGIDMALHLAARLTDDATARQVQLVLEYDPEPPFGGIDWTKVDRDLMVPMVNGWLAEGLQDRPQLLTKLGG